MESLKATLDGADQLATAIEQQAHEQVMALHRALYETPVGNRRDCYTAMVPHLYIIAGAMMVEDHMIVPDREYVIMRDRIHRFCSLRLWDSENYHVFGGLLAIAENTTLLSPVFDMILNVAVGAKECFKRSIADGCVDDPMMRSISDRAHRIAEDYLCETSWNELDPKRGFEPVIESWLQHQDAEIRALVTRINDRLNRLREE